MNPFFEIRTNNIPIELLQPIKEVKSVIIRRLPGIVINIPKDKTKAIAEWLYNLTQQVEFVEYNGVLINKEDINKPIHMP